MSSRAEQKVLQYVKEARAHELALVRVLQSQIAMAPRGTLRSGLESHLAETRDHAERLRVRAGELEHGFNPVALAVGVAEAVTGQALALAKTPLDLVRGTGGEEKVLKNAKDASATEALEIATYTALERLAELAGDETTATLARDIRADEERMLQFLLDEIPGQTAAVYGADVEGDPSFDPKQTGAADAARAAADAAGSAATAAAGAVEDAAGDTASAAKGAAATAKDAANDAKSTAKDAAGNAASGAKRSVDAASAGAKGDSTKADGAKADSTKSDSAKSDSAKSDSAKSDAAKADSAKSDAPAVDPDAEKPWAGYDELSVEEVRAVLLTADAETTAKVDAYERGNRGRKGILGVTEPQVQSA